MAFRKNTRRIDPRYFLDETAEGDKRHRVDPRYFLDETAEGDNELLEAGFAGDRVSERRSESGEGKY